MALQDQRLKVALLCVAAIAVEFLTVAAKAQEAAAGKSASAAASTALLRTVNEGGCADLGSAFCIDEWGLFLTTAHAASRLDFGSSELVISQAQGQQQSYLAQVIKMDRELNLAVLRVSGPAKFTPLRFADGPPPAAGTPVTVLAYPLQGRRRGRDLPISPIQAHPCKVTGKATHSPARSDAIVCDARLSWNDSGGPVLDEAGHVVGLIETAVISNRDPSTFIPLERIRKFLDMPQVSVAPAAIPYAQRHAENKVIVSVASLTKPAPAYQIDLSIQGSDGSRRTLTGAVNDGTCTFSFVPVPPSSSTPTTLTARFAQGSVTGVFVDRNLVVGGRTVALHDIRRVEHSSQEAESTVTLADGARLRGKVEGLESVSLNLADEPVNLDLSRIHSISVRDEDFSARGIDYLVQVKLDRVVVAQASGTIALSDAPGPLPSRQPVTSNAAVATMRQSPPAKSTVASDLNLLQTELAGGHGGRLITLCPRPPRDVVGFRYQLSTWDHKGIVQTLEPLYERENTPLDGTMLARDGYVVGGILADSDKYFHAFRVIFIRLNQTTLDPKDTYLSDWIGEPSSGEPPKQLAGNGEHVVGVCGRKGINMDAVGLLVRN